MECILPFTKQVSAIGEGEFPATFLQRKTETAENGQMVRQFSLGSFNRKKRNTSEGSPKFPDGISEK